MAPVADSRALGTALAELTADKLIALHRGVLPNLVLPGAFAGHPVGPDPACHLLKTLTFLGACGVAELDGIDVADHALAIANGIDPSIEAFSAFGFGESLARLGGLGAIDDPDGALKAVRSPDILRRIRTGDDPLPRNYAIVAARGLVAEQALTGERPADLDEFLERSAALLAQQDNGWINDMWSPLAHYDMYSLDMFLFAEPLAVELDGVWEQGLQQLVADLDDLATPAGVLTWGRSVGLLALAHTAEVAAVGAAHGLLASPSPWVRRAEQAARRLDKLMPEGLNGAHQYRATMGYRGPERRLQMGFDLLDKLAGAAARLLASTTPVLAAAPVAETWPPVNRLISLDGSDVDSANRVADAAPNAGVAAVWAVRNRSLQVHLPFLQGLLPDYLPMLHIPGVAEPPTEGPASFLPVIHHRDGRVLFPTGLPTDLSTDAPADSSTGVAELGATFNGWSMLGASFNEFSIAGHRRCRYTVEGRTVVVDEDLHIDDQSVNQITIAVPSTASRRLEVSVQNASTPDGEAAPRVRRIDTAGIAEWRSYFDELTTVHQIEVPLTDGRASFRWQLRPELRVADTSFGAAYAKALYGSIDHRVQRRNAPMAGATVDDSFREQIANFDVVHLAWPEWWSGIDPDRAAAMAGAIAESGTKLLWTRHNLIPHNLDAADLDRARATYQVWAQASDAVIHHSEWGRSLDAATYTYRADTLHRVISHGAWNHFRHGAGERRRIEATWGWSHDRIRLAVIGAPRNGKNSQDVIDAFVEADRDDLELVVRLSGSEQVPDDPRIIAEYGPLAAGDYSERLSAIDALVLPFVPDVMLTTGTVFDALGAGIGAICSDWSFLTETLGDAAIVYGSGPADLASCLRELDVSQLARSADGVAARAAELTWEASAEATLALLDELVP
jgi:glycosyltransferase involved in cell wall biosynthesis